MPVVSSFDGQGPFQFCWQVVVTPRVEQYIGWKLIL